MPSKPPSNAYRSARRESIVILVAWAVTCMWVIGYCGLNAYPQPDATADSMPLCFGFPQWVVWGIAVPWIACNLFTFWFCLFMMRDDDPPAEGKNA